MKSNEKTLIEQDIRPVESMAAQTWKRFRRHPGAMVGTVIIILMVLTALLAPFSPYDPEKSDIKSRFQAPSLVHPFGTDGLGRDLMTRTFYGGRVSMTVGVMVVLITSIIGISVGTAAGYYGGWIDNILMRIIDATLSLPSLLFMILLSAILREADVPFIESNSLCTIAIVLGILSWPTVAR
ncbi:MAG: ABC transporter permease, partial [Oceanicoccus sp.]|uniref:ABC transporter permease n=1 Tax=Oceanicoccus sp. TaxID=2691044 RepID=UPI00262EE256